MGVRRASGYLTVVAGAAAVAPFVVLLLLGTTFVAIEGGVHFVAVGATAIVAFQASLALTIVGAKRQDGRAILAGTAFVAMAALLAIHGLATPGILVGLNGLAALSAGLTLPVGAVVLALTAHPSLRRPHNVKSLLIGQAVLVAAIGAIGTVGMLVPDVVPRVPAAGSPLAMALLAFGLALFTLLAYRALRTYRLTRRAADFVVLAGLLWLSGALIGTLVFSFAELGWWLGHFYEVVGIGLVGGAVAYDLHRGSQSRPTSGDLEAARLVADEEAFLGPRVRALTTRLASKDQYTEDHTRRVALYAVQTAELLGLRPGQIRDLAIGGLLHDIGKLPIPDEILKKPADLSDGEYEIIKRHPQYGVELLRELGGFSENVQRLVRDHHERLNGTGYPSARHAPELDITTRILSVCDVYDALVTTRVYREAWSHEKAMLLLESGDSEFDQRCVKTLRSVVEGQQRPAASDAERFLPTTTENLLKTTTARTAPTE